MKKGGTLRKYMIKGISFDVAADADIEDTLTEFENSLIASSGAPLLKQEKRPVTKTGLVLLTTGAEREILKDIADGGKSERQSYTDRAGNVYRFSGSINVDSHTTMESRTTITLLPMTKVTAVLAK